MKHGTNVWTILAVALALVVGSLVTVYAQPLPGGTLDPTLIQKYQWPLVKPPAMPTSTPPAGFTGDYYEIAVRQFTQQIVFPALGGGRRRYRGPNHSVELWFH
jgi:hypothetical protein